MSKRKNSDDEDLREEIKALREENKQLSRKLRRLLKNSRKVSDLEEMIQDQDYSEVEVKSEPKCPKCGKDEYKLIDAVVRKFYRCQFCGHRSKPERT